MSSKQNYTRELKAKLYKRAQSKTVQESSKHNATRPALRNKISLGASSGFMCVCVWMCACEDVCTQRAQLHFLHERGVLLKGADSESILGCPMLFAFLLLMAHALKA